MTVSRLNFVLKSAAWKFDWKRMRHNERTWSSFRLVVDSLNMSPRVVWNQRDWCPVKFGVFLNGRAHAVATIRWMITSIQSELERRKVSSWSTQWFYLFGASKLWNSSTNVRALLQRELWIGYRYKHCASWNQITSLGRTLLCKKRLTAAWNLSDLASYLVWAFLGSASQSFTMWASWIFLRNSYKVLWRMLR